MRDEASADSRQMLPGGDAKWHFLLR